MGTVLNFSGRSRLLGAELRFSPWTFLGFAHSYYVGLRGHDMAVRQEIFLGTDEGEPVATTLGEQYLSHLFGGAEFHRSGHYMTTTMAVNLEGPLNKVSEEALSNLGRLNSDPGWMILGWNFQHSFYVEPLLFRERFRDVEDWKTSTLAHELFFRSRGQYVLTSDRVIPQQQFVAGGFRSVRGYPESLAAADHGWYLQSEYRLHIPRLLKPYSEFPREERPPPFRERWNVRPPRPLIQPDWNLMARAFMDYGQTENVRLESFETNQHLWGAGLGLEFQGSTHFNLRADVGMVLRSLDQFDSGSGGRKEIPGAQSGNIRIHFQGSIVW